MKQPAGFEKTEWPREIDFHAGVPVVRLGILGPPLLPVPSAAFTRASAERNAMKAMSPVEETDDREHFHARQGVGGVDLRGVRQRQLPACVDGCSSLAVRICKAWSNIERSVKSSAMSAAP